MCICPSSENAETASLDRMPAGTTSGEGVFREVSISRTLYKMISPAQNTHPLGAGIPFQRDLELFHRCNHRLPCRFSIFQIKYNYEQKHRSNYFDILF